MNWKPSLLLLTLLLQPACLVANPLFNGYTAQYTVSRNGIELGTTSRKLVKQAGNKLLFSSHTQAEGIVALFFSDIVTEQSLMEYKKGRILPLKYHYSQKGGSKHKQVEINYNWPNKTFSHTTKLPHRQLSANSHDLLSFQLALIQAVSRQQKAITFSIIDHKRIRTHSLEYLGKKSFPTSKGDLKTIHLGQKKSTNPYKFSFWCAPSYHYLPVLIRKIEHDGDVVTLRLKQVNGKRIEHIDLTDDGD